MNKPESERLLALFAIALVNHLPPDLSVRVAAQLDELGMLAAQDGDTSVGTSARELASLLAGTLEMTRQNRR